MHSDIARILLQLDAVSLRTDPPFTWASGRLSPIYCDNRMIISDVSARKLVTAGFADLLAQRGWNPDVIAGTATAGIPHAAWLADRLDKPMVYVRGAAKGHGKQNRVEGKLPSGASVVLVEDLISTGKSSLEAARGILEAGGTLLGVVAIFTYELDAAAAQFADAGIPLATLSTFSALLQVALDQGTLSAQQRDIIADWRADPAAWSVARGGAG